MNESPPRRLLYQKLGLKPNMKACFWDSPPDYFDTLLIELPHPLDITDELVEAPFDFIQAFITQDSVLEELFPRLRSSIHPKGAIWISWPKKSAPISADISLQDIRAAARELNLAESKMCSLYATWSAARFTFPKNSPK